MEKVIRKKINELTIQRKSIINIIMKSDFEKSIYFRIQKDEIDKKIIFFRNLDIAMENIKRR